MPLYHHSIILLILHSYQLDRLIWYSLGHGVVCLFFLIGTVRCVHCSIHLGSFWSPLGVILVTLGSILVALGSILVALGSPGDPRGTLWDQWRDFWWNSRILGPPLGTHFGTFSDENHKKIKKTVKKLTPWKRYRKSHETGPPRTLKIDVLL